MFERGYKRRKLLIDGSQRQLLAVYFFHFAIILVVTFAALAFVFNQQVLRSALSVEQKHEMASMIMSFSHRLWPVLWAVFFVLVIHSLYISNKIAGPLYRIRCVLTSVGTGNLKSRARIRGGDYLKQDAEAVNAMVRELDMKIGRMRRDWYAVGDELADLQKAIDDRSRGETKRRAEELASRFDRWKEYLDSFETTVSYTKPASAASTADTTEKASAEDKKVEREPSVVT
jgi:methyl-accepting chemotaxis protein